MASSSTLGSRLKFIGALVLGIALLALVLVIMGTRLDNQDVTPAPPSAAEEQRQDLAESAAKIETSAAQLGHSDLAQSASRWTESLGGVWIPWPDGAPEGHTNPPLETAPVASDEELSTLLGELSSELTDAPAIDSGTASAIALSAMYHRAQLSPAAECAEPDLGIVGEASADGVSVERLETARQWLEQSAASLAPGEREAQIARIDMLTDIIEVALDSGAPDTRPAAVAEPDSDPIEASYSLIFDQLLVIADRAQPQARGEIVNVGCVLASSTDAPDPSVLPGSGN